jgi:hypothetical protein
MNEQYPEKPVSVLDWILTIFILSIPLINLIMLIVWAFDSGTNPSKSNFAKASLIWMVISIVLSLLFFAMLFPVFSNIISEFGQSFNY